MTIIKAARPLSPGASDPAELCLPLDTLTEVQLEREVDRWLAETSTPVSPEPDVVAAYNCFIPRVQFFKNLPQNATVLDLGAGDGALSILKDWPLYPRADIKMYALSLDKGAMFDRYDGYELKDFESSGGVFQDVEFTAVNCAHFIEHMHDPRPTIDFISRRLSSGGRLYLEWPHAISKRMPRRTSFLEKGLSISTTRFDDDCTHVESWPMSDIVNLLTDAGFGFEAAGRIQLPWVGAQLRDHALPKNDMTLLTLAFWCSFGWAQYLVAQKL
jgi:SAM-dependent methyltransferase